MKEKRDVGISHIWYNIYGCCNHAGKFVFKGTFDECVKYRDGEDMESLSNPIF